MQPCDVPISSGHHEKNVHGEFNHFRDGVNLPAGKYACIDREGNRINSLFADWQLGKNLPCSV